MKKIGKTNAMRLLDQHQVEYTVIEYPHREKEAVDGVQVAFLLKEDVNTVYKTLVTRANTKEILVFMIPVDQELDLKKCARAAGVKSVSMIHVKEINALTGYIRGGCSPLGMKKNYRTFIEEDCLNQHHIFFSAGKIGLQIQMDPNVLISHFLIQPSSLIKDH